jgi:hypothetical protein
MAFRRFSPSGETCRAEQDRHKPTYIVRSSNHDKYPGERLFALLIHERAFRCKDLSLYASADPFQGREIG